MDAPRRRHWFRFSLTALFVLVTAVCVVLGYVVWQLQIVRERKAILTELAQVRGFSSNTLEKLALEPGYASNSAYQSLEYMRVPRLRHLLGDESYTILRVPQGVDRKLLGRMELAFPESVLMVRGPGPKSENAYRDSLLAPESTRQYNVGNVFRTGFMPESEEPDAEQ